MTVNGVTSAYSAYYSQQSKVGLSEDLSELIAQRITEDDADGDGTLSLEESGMEEELFSSIDSDADGLITSSEILAFIESMTNSMESAPPPPPPPPPSADELFSTLDVDGSGGISLEESGVSEEEFDIADTNKDGFVSLAELEEAFKNGKTSTPPSEMMNAETVSASGGVGNFQRQQMDLLLELLQGNEEEEDDSTSILSQYGKQVGKSINLVA